MRISHGCMERDNGLAERASFPRENYIYAIVTQFFLRCNDYVSRVKVCVVKSIVNCKVNGSPWMF